MTPPIDFTSRLGPVVAQLLALKHALGCGKSSYPCAIRVALFERGGI